MSVSILNVKEGDVISFNYTGFIKKLSATGKFLGMSESGKTCKIAVTPGNVWAVRLENLTINKIVEEAK